MALDAQELAGGLSLLSNRVEITLAKLFTTKHSLSTCFQIIASFEFGFLTNLYGPNFILENIHFLNSIQNLVPITNNAHWIIGGDFNIITSLVEKRGGTRLLDHDSQSFLTIIQLTNLVDLKNFNGMHTWNNCRWGQH